MCLSRRAFSVSYAVGREEVFLCHGSKRATAFAAISVASARFALFA